jgi:endogenous inhibitor of DNA gyrase (YacG/DUF329 family)
MRCPSCKVDVATDGAHKPFCSERCRLIDLGSWLDGKYRIAGEKNVDEVGTDGEPPDFERER